MSKQITIRMPKADLELWLAALRAPENQGRQGRGALFNKNDNGYCCLGVAQCIKTGGKLEMDDGSTEYFSPLPSWTWLKSVGWEFKDMDNRPTNNPYLPAFDNYAAMANDDLGMTFSEIADAIEDCAEGY